MTDGAPQSKGNAKAWVIWVVGIGTTYTMNWLSLHGVNFEVLGISSEVMKSGIEGTLFFLCVWATPDHMVDAIVCSILWWRRSIARIRDAFTQKLQQMRQP